MSLITQPFPEFGGITEWQTNTSNTWYNSLQVDGLHRLSYGLVLHGNWTYSKLMDSGGWADQTFRIPYRGIDGNDRTHVASISGVYTIPVGRGRTYLGNMNRIVDSAIGGWELGSLYKFQTGSPITMSMYYKNSAHVTPHIQKDNGYIREIAPCVEQWDENNQQVYTMTQFTQYDAGEPLSQACPNGADMENPESWMPGANPIYIGRALRSQQFDANLSKNFALAEGFHLQVRMEAFNALNHPLWSQGPDTNQQDSTFGTVEKGAWGQSNLPRQMQLSAKVTW